MKFSGIQQCGSTTICYEGRWSRPIFVKVNFSYSLGLILSICTFYQNSLQKSRV